MCIVKSAIQIKIMNLNVIHRGWSFSETQADQTEIWSALSLGQSVHGF